MINVIMLLYVISFSTPEKRTVSLCSIKQDSLNDLDVWDLSLAPRAMIERAMFKQFHDKFDMDPIILYVSSVAL